MMPVPLLKPLLTHFPLRLPGNIYGSAMPFGLYDPEGQLFEELRRASISTIVALAELEECQEKTGRDLWALYRTERLTVLYLPTPNYGVPSHGELTVVLSQTLEHAANGQNVLIHCSAGLGQTALFATLLAKQRLGLSGIEALEWLRRCKPSALLTPVQIMMVLKEAET